MSIATKTGDDGTTGLMYNRRVPKTHPRVEACGNVDELNAALGLARASSVFPSVRETLLAVQRDLIDLMGEVATALEDLTRYTRDGFKSIGADRTATLDRLIGQIEAEKITYRGWALPGDSMASAALDYARTVCRRAERSVCALQAAGELRNSEIIIYLNRLSDALWLLARWTEAQSAAAARKAEIA